MFPAASCMRPRTRETCLRNPTMLSSSRRVSRGQLQSDDDEATERVRMNDASAWPDLPLAAWSETCDTLHLWTQIVGKVRMASTPLVNHWWNVTFHVTSRGLATLPIPHGARTFEMAFDFIDHQLIIATDDGRIERLALAPMAVADFYAALMDRLRRLGIEVHIWTMPSEIKDAVSFDQDRTHAHYDPA